MAVLSPTEDAQSSVASDQTHLSWDDPREKKNPRNWSILMKILHTAIPCFLAFQITFTTSVTVPATDSIAKYFNVSRTDAILPLTLYTIGVAFGPVVVAPLSEEFGRKYIYIGSLTCLLAFTGGASAAKNFATLLVCRFLAGILGSAGIAMGAGTIADIWALEKAGAQASLLFILGPFLGPSLGPLAGAYVLSDRENDWRWTQYVLLLVGAPIWMGVLLMKETSKWKILGVGPHTNNLSKKRRTHHIVGEAIVRPIKMLFTEVIVLALAIYTAFAYAMIFSYFASSTYVLQTYYGFSLRQVGLSFISVIIGYVLASFLFGVFDKTLYAKAAQASPTGKASPEHRLYSALVGGFFLSASLFWNAWEAHPGGNWAALVSSGIFLGFGSFSLFLSSITYMVDFYRARLAASALAANGIIRYILGAVFPLFTIQMYQNLGVHHAGTIFASISIMLLPIPWLLFMYTGWLGDHSPFVLAQKTAEKVMVETQDGQSTGQAIV